MSDDLVNVRYGATGMDDHNRSARTVRLDLSVVDGLGEPATGVRGLRLWVSGDQARTWREVAVKGSGASRHVNVVAPRGASTISVRAEAWTADARVTGLPAPRHGPNGSSLRAVLAKSCLPITYRALVNSAA